MNRLRQMMLIAAISILFSVGCAPTSENISSTVESQVAESVKATVGSQPTRTPASTYTPLPTLVPEATYTPYPTYTPQPTFTPQATYTPFPTVTWTPTPEDTATAVPTNTPVPQTVIQATAVPPTNASATDNLAALKTEFANTLADIDLYRGSFTQDKPTLYGRVEWRPVNCPENIAIHDRIISTITLDVSQDIEVVQSAYATYLYAVNYFAEIMAPWNQGCQEAIDNGETTKVMDNFQRNLLLNEIATILSWLNPANDQLKQLGD